MSGENFNIADLFEVGETYVINLPPGWLIGGTVVEKRGCAVILENCVHLETTGPDVTTMGDLPQCNDPEQMEKICTRANGYAPRHTFNANMAIQWVRCVRDLTPLYRSKQKAAVRSIA